MGLTEAPERWRLLRHGPATGALNMARDEAIGRAVAARLSPPTLRLYAWDPPCVSLGRHQSLLSVDAMGCTLRGYQIVRRPTGGRAVLHTDELTYSVIARSDTPLVMGSVLDSYLRLSLGLAGGLARLGIQVETAPETNHVGPDASAACFEVPSAYEIVARPQREPNAGLRKLLGSAQCRRADYVLQHGSLPLCGDLTRLVDCLTFDKEAERQALRRSLSEHAATVHEILGHEVTLEEAASAMAEGFAAALGLDLVPGELSETEESWSAELARSKYGHPEWTEKI